MYPCFLFASLTKTEINIHEPHSIKRCNSEDGSGLYEKLQQLNVDYNKKTNKHRTKLQIHQVN